MSHWEKFPSLAIGVLLAAGAMVVLASNPRSTPNRFFAAFLTLVSANYVLDWLALAFPISYAQAGVTPVPLGSPAAECFDCNPFHQMAKLLVPFDGALLLYFAAIYPRRSRAARWIPWIVALPLLGVVILDLLDPPSGSSAPTLATVLANALFHACYLGALALAVRSLLRAEFPATRASARAMLAALLVAVAPRVALVNVDLGFEALRGSWPALALRIGIASLVIASALLAVRRQPDAERALTRPWMLAALAMNGAIFATWALALTYPRASLAAYIYGLRWVFFAGLVGYALTRHAFLDIDKRIFAAARSGVPIIAGLAVFIALWLVLSRAAGHGGSLLAAGEWLAAAGGLLATVGVATARGVATPPDAFQERKLTAYRALVEAHVDAQRDTRDGELALHRRRLAVSERQHDDIVALVLAERAVANVRGPQSSLPRGFRTLEVFAAGPTSWTILAQRDADPARVVVKSLRPEWRANPRVREAFEREGRILSTVRHPNLVRVVEIVAEPPAIVLEHAEQGSLTAAIQRDGPLGPDRLARLAKDLLAGLAELHARGFVHRDLKPDNVLFAADGRALIADLGSAHEDDSNITGTRVRLTKTGEVGTVLYMAPEQVLGRSVDARTDLHALGALLVFAATGRHYLGVEDLSEFEVKRLILEGPQSLPDLGSLGALVEACLRRDPDERPADAKSALRILGA